MNKRERSRLSNRLRQLSWLLGGVIAPSCAVEVAEMDANALGAAHARATNPSGTAGVFSLVDEIPTEFGKTRSRLSDATPSDQAVLLRGVSELISSSALEAPGLGLVASNLALLCVISLVFGFGVAPQFEELFGAFGTDLPRPTQVSLLLLGWLLAPASLLALGCAILYSVWQRHPDRLGKLTPRLDAFVRRVPLIGRVGLAMDTRQIAAWLSVSGAGESATRNLECMAELVQSSVLRRRVERVASRLASGSSLADSFGDSEWLPGLAKVLKEHPNDAQALGMYAASLQISFENELDRFVWRVQLVSGLIVGFIVISMYLPIFKMGTVV